MMRQGLGLDQISKIWSPLAQSQVAEKVLSRVGLRIFISIAIGDREGAKGYD